MRTCVCTCMLFYMFCSAEIYHIVSQSAKTNDDQGSAVPQPGVQLQQPSAGQTGQKGGCCGGKK